MPCCNLRSCSCRRRIRHACRQHANGVRYVPIWGHAAHEKAMWSFCWRSHRLFCQLLFPPFITSLCVDVQPTHGEGGQEGKCQLTASARRRR